MLSKPSQYVVSSHFWELLDLEKDLLSPINRRSAVGDANHIAFSILVLSSMYKLDVNLCIVSKYGIAVRRSFLFCDIPTYFTNLNMI